jgi:hypothetical protein
MAKPRWLFPIDNGQKSGIYHIEKEEEKGLTSTMIARLYTYRFRTIFSLLISCIFLLSLSPAMNAQDKSISSENSPIPIGDDAKNRSIENTIKTQWMDPDGSQPVRFADWYAQHGIKGSLEITRVFGSVNSPDKTSGAAIAILVNSDLYLQTSSSLELFALDLTGEGYDVTTYYMSGGSPQSLRTFLQSLYAEGLQGCLLVGDLPVPWYENLPEEAEFPCDLYYMDMDGIFSDDDDNGMFESHTGNVTPEIYVGRLTASPLTLDGVNEVDLLNDYFRKNHLYRCGMMPVDNRALVYVDDDWAGPGWSFDMANAYGRRTTIYDRWVTWAPDYMSRLPESYEFIGVFVHSWSGGHAFKDPTEAWSWMYNYEIKAIQPRAHFYNLFACSNSRYVEPDYCGGWYIFSPDHGLASVGSAKTGSMLNFQHFYNPFGEGKEIGLAFQEWFAAQGADGFAQWEIDWYYGMTLCGDPTLTIQKKSNNQLLQFDDGAAAYMMALPHASADLYNVRMTPDQACTLSTIQTIGIFPDIPVRMYIWNSDGVYPYAVIDSVDIPNGDLGLINLTDRNMILEAGIDYHFGFTVLDPAPAETLWIYMDNGQNMPEVRSGMYHDGQWKTQTQFYGANYNFMIRAEVRYPSEPEVTIMTTTIADGIAGGLYDEVIDVSGGIPPYSWDITAGSLPDGLILNSSAGKIEGAPSAEGIYHFTVRATDSDDPAQSDVQHLDVAFTYVCGDINCDAQVNVADAVFVINYVFKGGPAPSIFLAADANCDGDINVADGVYIINYVFNGGPAPCCP